MIPCFCKIPRDITEAHVEYMRLEANNIIESRLSELLKAIDGDSGEWAEFLDERHVEAEQRLRDAESDFEANGGRGVILAENVDRLRREVDMLEFEAQRRFIGRYLNEQIDYFIMPVLDEELDAPLETNRVDPLPDSEWALLLTDMQGGDGTRLHVLDWSHVTRIDLNMYAADELVEEFEDFIDDDGLLDDFVQDYASHNESDLNNSGMREQAYFLLNSGASLEEIRAVFERAMPDPDDAEE